MLLNCFKFWIEWRVTGAILKLSGDQKICLRRMVQIAKLSNKDDNKLCLILNFLIVAKGISFIELG